MTPFGSKLRQLRNRYGITQRELADTLGVTPAYLSALEHGRRGRPSWAIVQKIIGYFNIIWDEAEEMEALAKLSHPRIVVDTSGLDPVATEFVNCLARDIRKLSPERMAGLLKMLKNGQDD